MSRYRRLFDLRLGGRRRSDAELDQELASHIAMRVADLVRAGMSRDDAERAARARFGDFERAQRTLREGASQREASLRRRDRLGAMLADMRHALRQFRRAPGFTALAVATLALGIGATTTIFTLVDRVLLRPLPYPHSERIVRFEGMDSTNAPSGTVSMMDFADWRRASSLETSAIYGIPYRQGIVGADSALRVSAVRTTSDFFAVLRPTFVLGRPFSRSEIESGAPVVVIGERLWRELFAADPHLIRPLRTAVRSYTIVGVVAADQSLPERTDVWFPVATSPTADGPRVNVNWFGIARLREGATVERATVEMTTIARGIVAADPSALYDHGVLVHTLADVVVGPIASYLKMLMGAVLVVLLIVCANVAASALARASSRTREMAIRASLGAERGRLIQQMLIEHGTLGLCGGVVGALGAWAAVRAIVARWGAMIPRAAEVSPDARVLVVAFVASLLAGVSAGLIPALRASGSSPRALLAAGGRTAAKGGRQLAGASLVTTEIALAVLLLTGSVLLMRSFRAVLARDLGFDTQVATVEAALTGPRFATDATRRYLYWDALVAQLHALPGVEAVGLSQWIPLGLTGQGFIDVRDRDLPGASAVYRAVNDEFFSALRVPVLAGRVFDRGDDLHTPRVALVNQTLARRYWPGQNPLGKQLRARGMERGASGGTADWLTVVGVVGDVRTYGLESEPRAELYVDFRQVPSYSFGLTALVRGPASASTLANEARRAARAVDAQVSVDVGTLDALLQRTLSTRTLTLWLLSAFAAAALALAALGIYGVLSYSVAQRTRELAVRAALGAERGQLLRLVLEAGMRVVVAGMAFGLAAALVVMRALESMLFETTAHDVASYALAAATIFVVCVLAILVPARRATRLDPIIALQAE